MADQLQWDSSSVVISDNKDIFDHDFLKSLNLEGRFSIVKKPIYEHQNHNYRNDNHNYGNDNNVYGNQSHVYYDTTNNPLENVSLKCVPPERSPQRSYKMIQSNFVL